MRVLYNYYISLGRAFVLARAQIGMGGLSYDDYSTEDDIKSLAPALKFAKALEPSPNRGKYFNHNIILSF